MTDAAYHVAILIVTIALFAALWPASLRRRDASVVDALWGPGFAIAGWLAWAFAGAPDDPRAYVLLALVTLWSLRLSILMAGRKRRTPGEDPRYTELRKSWEPGFWWKSLFVVFLLQATLQWVLSLPVQRVMFTPEEAFGAIAWLGLLVAIVGLSLETAADAQLDRFKIGRPQSALCDIGLWSWCRHPNYLGEIVFWWGVWLVAFPAVEIWTIVAPLLLTVLVRWVSGVPLLEEHLERTKPDFPAYRDAVPMLWPRRPAPGQTASDRAPPDRAAAKQTPITATK